jgi:hypothetical protein
MEQRASTWIELSASERDRYCDKLGGIYGHEGDEAAYNALPTDKHEALRLISDRLLRADLWQYVGRIVNVYGVGGVGMYFSPVGDLDSELGRRTEFTRWFARHHDNSGGFLEIGRKHASLHFLYIDPPEGEREWHVHLDLYGGWGSLITAIQHLYWERWKKYRPDWRIMKQWAD